MASSTALASSSSTSVGGSDTQDSGFRPTVLGPFNPVDNTSMGSVSITMPIPSKTESSEIPYDLPLPKPLSNAGVMSVDPAIDHGQTSLAMPEPILNFEGGNNLFGVYPPDTDGDVGPNHYVQMVNLYTMIYDKQGNLLYGPFTPSSLWPAGDPCFMANDGDVVALYDQLADRWLLSQFGFPNYPQGPYYECIAISRSAVPTNVPNNWWLYTLAVSTNKMNDYPKLAVWPDAYYMTANQFTNAKFWGGAGVWALERDKMLLGQTATVVYFDLATVNSSYGGMLPVDWDGSTLPPEGAPGYFVEVDDGARIPSSDAARLWKFDVDWANPASSTFGVDGHPNATLAVDNFNLLPCTISGSRSCIPQPGTNVELDAIGDRLMFRAVYRNFGDHEAIAFNHTVLGISPDIAGIRWYELRNPGGTPIIYQQGTFVPPDGIYRWMGSLAFDHVGNIALGYSASSGTVYPSIRYTGRLTTDPLGLMSQGEAGIIIGSGSQTGTGSRWGDYSAMSVDPVDDCTFWYTQEYIQTTGFANWQTRIATFKFPNCTMGAQGTLSGTVTDEGGASIENATIHATASLTMTAETTTDTLGQYSLTLLTGSYAVDASAYGYEPQSVSNVVVNENQTTIQDFVLGTATAYTVTGVVSDATAAWPLYAQINIDGYPGDPIWTNPETGAYSVELFGGIEYTFNVSAFSVGYIPASVPVGPLTASQVIDIELDIDQEACSAPGYAQVATGKFEPFDATAIPAEWTVVDHTNPPTGQVWSFDDPGKRGNLTGGSGNFAVVNSDYYGVGGLQNTSLVSPIIDMTSLEKVLLEFDTDFYRYVSNLDEIADVDVSIDSGATWTNVWHKQGASYRGPKHEVINITILAAGQHDVRIRFHYGPAQYEWWWQVDNVFVGQKTCELMDGGLVVGTVLDGLTLTGLNNANVTNQAGYSTLTIATPLDPSEDNGFYTLFSPAGSQVFTATLTSYPPAVDAIAVEQGNTVHHNFTLGSGHLTYTPGAIELSIPAGMTTTVPVTLSNTGTNIASYELMELSGGAVPFGPYDPPPDWVVRSFRQQLPSSEGTGIMPSPTDWDSLPAGEVIDSWQTKDFIWGVASDDNDNTVWVNSPGLNWNGGDRIMEYPPDGSLPRRIYPHNQDIMPHASGPADLAFNWNTGKLWVMNLTPGANCVYEINPDSGYTGNKICPQSSTGFTVSQRGLAYDPASDTYFAGGWNDSFVYRFDVNGTILSSQNTGLAIAGLAYNPSTQHLFVMVNNSTANIYVLDVSNNYSPVGMFHVAGFDAYSGAGLEIACDGKLWAVNQKNKAVYLIDSGEAADLCDADVPWLSETPSAGTLAPGTEQIIDVGLDATILQPGLYTAQVKFNNDTPFIVPNLPVTMTVTAPPGWGKLEGTVTDLGYCDEDPAPMIGAVVTVTTSTEVTHGLITDALGHYQIWMDASVNSPLTITVDVPEHNPGSVTGLILTGGQVTYQDFNLRWLKPCTSVAPTALTMTLESGQTQTETLELHNTGAASTGFTFNEKAGGSTPFGPENLGISFQPIMVDSAVRAPSLHTAQSTANGLVTDAVPWLSEVPTQGTVLADSSFPVDISFTPAFTQTAGLYTATLMLETDDPVGGLIEIPVTMRLIEYSLDLAADVASKTGMPGASVTYSVTITNTSQGVSDSFDLSLLPGSVFASELSTITTPVLDPGEIASFQVSVTIPADALNGGNDNVIVQAEFHNKPNHKQGITLTTNVSPLYALALTPATEAKNAQAGEPINYTLHLENKGNVGDIYSFSATGNIWTVQFSIPSVSLEVGKSADVVVSVLLPHEVSYNDSDTAVIHATSSGDPSVSGQSTLTTTVRSRALFLPVVIRP